MAAAPTATLSPTISAQLQDPHSPHRRSSAPLPPSYFSTQLATLTIRVLSLHRHHQSPSPLAVAAVASAASAAFEAEAAAGTVECFSGGCRPVYDEDEACTAYDENASPATLLDREREDGSGAGLMSCQIRRLLSGGMWAEPERAERYYESALRVEPRNSVLLAEYALFAWNALADASRADQLFGRAVDAAPSDASILASYASFLWQADA